MRSTSRHAARRSDWSSACGRDRRDPRTSDPGGALPLTATRLDRRTISSGLRPPPGGQPQCVRGAPPGFRGPVRRTDLTRPRTSTRRASRARPPLTVARRRRHVRRPCGPAGAEDRRSHQDTDDDEGDRQIRTAADSLRHLVQPLRSRLICVPPQGRGPAPSRLVTRPEQPVVVMKVCRFDGVPSHGSKATRT